MRERILDYLRRSSEPVSADRILKDVLRIVSPNVLSAERVLDRIVGRDRRFVRVAGRWRAEPERKYGLERAAVLHFEAARGTAGRLGRGAIWIPETAQSFEFHLGDARSAVTAHEVAADRPLLAWNSARVCDWNRMLRVCGVAPWVQGSISLERLAARALGDAARGNLDGLAARLGLRGADPDRPQSMARLLYDCAVEILQAVPPEHRDLEALIRWIDSGREKVDFGRFAFGPELLDDLPLSPGVYLMRNRAGDALYVGKARSLRSRVRSYFKPRALSDPKVRRIHSQLHSLEWISTPSELEALLLEMKLIRRLHPSVNLQAEVHEQSDCYGKHGNLILLVPASVCGAARAYFLRDGVFVADMPVRLGREPSATLRRKIRSVYFSSRRTRRMRPAWEIEIVARWLAANRLRLNFVDVDEGGSCKAVLALVTAYLSDPERLSRKVYYRAAAERT